MNQIACVPDTTSSEAFVPDTTSYEAFDSDSESDFDSDLKSDFETSYGAFDPDTSSFWAFDPDPTCNAFLLRVQTTCNPFLLRVQTLDDIFKFIEILDGSITMVINIPYDLLNGLEICVVKGHTHTSLKKSKQLSVTIKTKDLLNFIQHMIGCRQTFLFELKISFEISKSSIDETIDVRIDASSTFVKHQEMFKVLFRCLELVWGNCTKL